MNRISFSFLKTAALSLLRRFCTFHFTNCPADLLPQFLLSLQTTHLVRRFGLFEFLHSKLRFFLVLLLLGLIIDLDHLHHIGYTLFMRRMNNGHAIAIEWLLRIFRARFRFVFVWK